MNGLMGTMPCWAYILQRLQQPQPCPRAGVLGSSVFFPSIVSLISNCDKHNDINALKNIRNFRKQNTTWHQAFNTGYKSKVDTFSERVLSFFYVIYVNTIFTFLTYWYDFKHKIKVCMIVTGPIWNKTILSVVHDRVDPSFYERKVTQSYLKIVWIFIVKIFT